jgi:hypothetical protein
MNARANRREVTKWMLSAAIGGLVEARLNATMSRIEFIFPSWNELNLQRSGRIALPFHRK